MNARRGIVLVAAAVLAFSVIAASAVTHYVVKNSATPVAPYTNWLTAARSIPDALSEAASDAIIEVSNGTYEISAEILIDRDIGVSSVNGPDVTVIDAGGSNRCVYVAGSKTTLSGFTLTGGRITNDSGAGAYCEAGASIVDCIIRDNVVTGYTGSGGGVYLRDNSRLIDSTVRDNIAQVSGGGVYIYDSGRVDHCIIRSNNAYSAGGVYVRAAGEVLRSEVRYNTSTDVAGGIYLRDYGRLRSSIVADNSCTLMGGGLYIDGDAAVENCTIAENLADEAGGMFLSGVATVRNSIVYFNFPDDIYAPDPHRPDVSFSCIRPLLPGLGNFSQDPDVSALYRLAPGSPCQNAGTNQSWMGLADDIDGNDRIVNSVVDIGASEFVTSSLACNFIADEPEGLAPHTVVFTAHVAWTNTTPLTYSWDVDNDTVIDFTGVGMSVVTNTYTNYGYHSVYLGVTPGIFPFAKRTKSNYIKVGPHTAYVNPAGLNVYPFTSWANGSPTIAGAVGAGVDGTLVLITNDTYMLANQVLVDRAIHVKGFHGAGVTYVDGDQLTRCFYMTHSNAVIEGLDIRNGWEPRFSEGPRGGGVFSLEGGSILNCILVSNVASSGGGAAFNMNGLVTNTLFRTNVAVNGGGLFMNSGGRVEQTFALGNSAQNGGGLFMGTNTELVNSYAYSNVVSGSGGGVALLGGVASNVYAQWNSAGAGGGGIASYGAFKDSFFRYNTSTNLTTDGFGGGGLLVARGTIDGCTVFSNTAMGSGGGVLAFMGGTVTGCTIQANVAAEHGGGAVGSGPIYFENCDFLDNIAVFGGGMVGASGTRAFDCLFASNQAQAIGGLQVDTTCRIERCSIINNEALHTNGYVGGVMASTNCMVMDCIIRGNTSEGPVGGGACGSDSVFRNCAVSGNRARGWGGGLAFFGSGSRIESCSIAGNTADTGGGVGMFGLAFVTDGDGAVQNSIIYNNHPDPILEGADIAVSNSCVSILPTGAGNFDTRPEMADIANGDLRLLAGSPCVNAGQYEDWMLDEEDLGGTQRVIDGVVDLGAYEFDAGDLSAAPYAVQTEGSNTLPLIFYAMVDGVNTSGLYYVWDFDNDGAIEFEGYGLDTITNIMSGYGRWTIALTVSNSLGQSFTTVREHYVRIGPSDVYVAHGGGRVFPYDTWAKAATGIHEAVVASISDSTIWISNGIHAVTQQVVLDKPLQIVGFNGPTVTHLANDKNQRFFYLSHSNAVVQGVTLSEGQAYRIPAVGFFPLSFSYGGGVYINGGGRVEDCDINKCNAANRGGGVYLLRGGHVTDSDLTDNTSVDGAGVFLQSGGSISNCDITANISDDQGGGASLSDGGWLGYSLLKYNVATNGAGIHCSSGGTVFACNVLTNTAFELGGGIYCFAGGEILNSTNRGNIASDGGGLYGSYPGVLVSNCYFDSNQAGNYGGAFMIHGARVLDSDFIGNRASNVCGGALISFTSTIERSRITLNTASNVGGLYVLGGVAEDCTVDANMAYGNAGGAAVVGSGSITGIVRDTLFSNNTASVDGGGVLLGDSTVMVSCDIVDNIASNNGGGLYMGGGRVSIATIERNWARMKGGGAYLDGDGDLRYSDILSNNADYGGGAFLDGGGSVFESDIAFNYAIYAGGGAYVDDGGRVASCTLSNNSSDYGGAAYCYASGVFARCVATGNEVVLDGGGFALDHGGVAQWCEVTGNRAGRNGGGLLLNESGQAMNTLIVGNAATNLGGGVYADEGQLLLACTVVDNWSDGNGGGVYWISTNAVTNSIIYGNTSTGPGSNYVFVSVVTSVAYSCVAPLLTGAGNTASDPLFANMGDYHVSGGSPCIDSGIGGYPIVDLDSVPRPLDGDGGGTAEIDMGAYEYAGANSDTDSDGLSDADEVYTHGTRPTDPDTDDDDQSDGEEIIADTDPLSATNYFAVTWIMSHGGMPQFTWHGTLDRLYDIQQSIAMTGEWTHVTDGTNIVGVAGEMAFTNSTPWVRLQDAFRVTVRMDEP